MTEPPAEYLSAEDLATELGVHIQTVQKYFRDGVIPGRKIGKSWRTSRAAFNQWLTSGPVPAPIADAPVGHVLPPLETK